MITHALLVFSYNQVAFVGRCVNSIMNMSVLPTRIVWFDDGSTDGTVQEVSKLFYGCNFFELKRNYSNLGLYKNLNTAINDWGCDFVHFLACDDYFVGDYFCDFNKFIRINNINCERKLLILSNHISTNGTHFTRSNYLLEHLNISGVIRGKFTTRNLGISSSLFGELGPYDSEIGIWADRLWEIKLIYACNEIHFMPGAYHCYSIGTGISSKQSRVKQIKSLLTVNEYLLKHATSFSFNKMDVSYLKFAVSRDKFELNPTIINFLYFSQNLFLNINNGIKLRDFQCLMPEVMISLIKRFFICIKSKICIICVGTVFYESINFRV
jgi:glycosyltransferase involved in cell wall biosynthesis